MRAELTSLLLLSPNRAEQLDGKLGDAVTALYRLHYELLALSGSERKAALTLAPEGCPDLTAVIRQLGRWRDPLYGYWAGQEMPDGYEKPSAG